jgi:ethanolamine utilization microcompartment shell protein EutS
MSGSLPAGLTYTNSSTTRTYFGSDGLLKTAAANEPIFEWLGGVFQGMRWEMEQRTNLALWNRDLTQAAWVSTNGTPLKNQTGIDGVANSASSFTATAGNATCLQSITSASAARVTSFFLKRLTGTGTVNITQDNGTTWTAVTLTSAWQRFQVTATAANPVIGIRVVTSGDAVALDFAQHETPATVASSPIATTTAAVTRQPDVLTASSISWYRQDEGTVVFEGIASATDAVDRGFYAFTNGTITNRILSLKSNINNGRQLIITGSVIVLDQQLSTLTSGSVFRSALSYKLNDSNSAVNNVVGTTDTTVSIPAINQLRFGSTNSSGTEPFMGYARRFDYYNTRLPDATIQGLSRV